MVTKKILGEKVTRYETPMGIYWVPDIPANGVIESAMRNGNFYDDIVFNELKSYISVDSVVLDLGANLGQMSIEFAKVAKTVHSFEANKFLYKIMCLNLRENNINNVIHYNNAVWDVDNVDLLYPNPDFGRFSSRGSFGIEPNASDGQKIKSITIDSLDLEKVDVVKIDIQGSDLKAMMGMKKTIEKFKPVIVFELESQFLNNFNVTSDTYIQFIEEINYVEIKNFNGNYLIVARDKD